MQNTTFFKFSNLPCLKKTCFKVKLTILNVHFFSKNLHKIKKGQLSCPKFSDSTKIRIELFDKI